MKLSQIKPRLSCGFASSVHHTNLNHLLPLDLPSRLIFVTQNMQVMTKNKTDKQLLLPARQLLPEKYLPVELLDGNAVIPRDFFLTMCSKKLKNDWAVLSVALAPYVEPAAIDSNTNIVNANHPTGKNTLFVRSAWLHKVINILFGKQYRNTVRMGWDN